MTDLELYRQLPRAIQEMIDRGELDVPTVRRIARAHRHERRTYDNAYGKVIEVIDTFIEIVDFD